MPVNRCANVHSHSIRLSFLSTSVRFMVLSLQCSVWPEPLLVAPAALPVLSDRAKHLLGGANVRWQVLSAIAEAAACPCLGGYSPSTQGISQPLLSTA